MMLLAAIAAPREKMKACFATMQRAMEILIRRYDGVVSLAEAAHSIVPALTGSTSAARTGRRRRK